MRKLENKKRRGSRKPRTNVDLPGQLLYPGLRWPLKTIASLLNGSLDPQSERISPEEKERATKFFRIAQKVASEGRDGRFTLASKEEWVRECEGMSMIPTLVVEGKRLVWEFVRYRESEELALKLCILKMVEESTIGLVVECACGCGKWIARKKKTDRFANNKCRTAQYQSTPKAKELRAKSQREAYFAELKKDRTPAGKRKLARLIALRKKRGTYEEHAQTAK